MKMNTRLFAAFTAAVITVCASSMSVFAANEDHTAEQTFTGETNTWDPTHDDQTVDSDTYDPSAKVNVNLSNDPSYTVTIPADVSFGDSFDAQTNKVKVEDVFLEKGQSVKVPVSSKNDYKLLLDGTDADMFIPYSVTSDKAELDEVITVASGSRENKGTGTATLTYSIADGTDIPVAGAYSDILTFNIAVEDPVPEIQKIAPGVKWKIGDDLDFGDGVYVKSDWSGARVVSGVHNLRFCYFASDHYYGYWDGFGGDYNMNDDGRSGETVYGYEVKGSGTSGDPYYLAPYHTPID